jgi:4'-phosphopantetheinyl transferase
MATLTIALHNLPEQLILKRDFVEVYYLNLDEQLTLNYLSTDEEIRANRYKFEHLKNRFIVTRNILRILLGKYLKLHPKEIIFNYNQKGKPTLDKNCNYLNLEFNISHSENFALYGFVLNRKIGVDLEKIRPIKELDKIAHRFFSLSEYKLITNSKNPEKQQIFFKMWTAKEAYLKAIGTGISEGLDSIEIDNLHLKINQQNLNNWQLYNLETEINYQASLVIESSTKLPLNLIKLSLSG